MSRCETKFASTDYNGMIVGLTYIYILKNKVRYPISNQGGTINKISVSYSSGLARRYSQIGFAKRYYQYHC